MTRGTQDEMFDAAPLEHEREPVMRSLDAAIGDASVPCDACGYDRRGLPLARACPECGHVPQIIDLDPRGGNVVRRRDARRDHQRAQARLIFAGLVLLLFCTLPAIEVVLYQPFRGGIGGTLPALNFPGPKLWAMPLLQRAIGNGPGEAGVSGTRACMLSLLAIWLITIAPRDEELDVAPTLRLLTRWVATIAFGLGLGLLLASGGIWPSERLPYWLVLGGGIELPAAALLYAYLARVGRHMLPTKSLHAALGALVWIVPLLIGGSIALFVLDPSSEEYVGLSRSTAQFGKAQHALLSAVVGLLLTIAGVMATATVTRLAVGLAGIGFPRAARFWSAAGLGLRGAMKRMRRIDPSRLRAATVAGGLLLWIIASWACVDATNQIANRKGLGGNLPFFNYVGPKVTAIPIENGFGGRSTAWFALPGVHAVLLNLFAVAMIATPLTNTRAGARRMPRLNFIARWLPVLMAGAIFGACQGWRWAGESENYRYYGYASGDTSEFAAAAIVFCDLPATIVLYVLLMRLADELSLPRVRNTLSNVTITFVALMSLGLLSFVISHRWLAVRQSSTALVMGSIYGAASAGAALAATLAIFALAGKLIRDRVMNSDAGRAVPECSDESIATS